MCPGNCLSSVALTCIPVSTGMFWSPAAEAIATGAEPESGAASAVAFSDLISFKESSGVCLRAFSEGTLGGLSNNISLGGGIGGPSIESMNAVGPAPSLVSVVFLASAPNPVAAFGLAPDAVATGGTFVPGASPLTSGERALAGVAPG